MKKIRCKNIILPDGMLDGWIFTDRGKIARVSAVDRTADGEIDLSDLFIAPGFIDLHTHGGGGFSFTGSVEDIVAAANYHLSHGTTALCPTISADDFSVMKGAVERIGAAMTDPRLIGTIPGAHPEGPYLSEQQAGAQCAACITAPREEDYLPLLAARHTAIARWTYAPERDEGEKFVKALSKYGVLPSAGHTDATYADMRRAMENGCRLVTHLYSCTSTVTRDHGFRIPGVIETAFLEDDLFVEIICDGRHLPPELIRLVYKIKGPDKIALVTDSLSLAGTAETHGFMQNTEYVIEDGVCKLMDRSAFAGSIATADRLLRVAVREAGIPLRDAVKMLTSTPAAILGLTDRGAIEAGKAADLVALDQDLTVRRVFVGGEVVYKAD